MVSKEIAKEVIRHISQSARSGGKFGKLLEKASEGLSRKPLAEKSLKFIENQPEKK